MAMTSHGYAESIKTSRAPEGIQESMDTQIKRLSEIAIRLETIGDAIHGSVPQDASTAGEPRPVATVASRLRDIAELIGRVDNATSRISTGL